MIDNIFARAVRASALGNMVVRMDKVDDGATINNSSFYDFGTSDFSIGVGLLLVENDLVNSSTSSMDIIGKRAGDSTKFVLGNFNRGGTTDPNRFAFTIDEDPTKSIFVSSDSVSQVGVWYDVVAQRKGGSAAANALLENYELIVNGVVQPSQKTQAGTEAPLATINAPFNLAAGASTDSLYRRRPMYLDYAFCYNRALSLDEIIAIRNTRQFPATGAKGVWEIPVNSGFTIPDSSSAGQSCTLIGYTDTEVGATDPNTNTTYVHRNGVIFVPANSSTASTVFTAPRGLSVKQIARFNATTMTATATHKRGGVTLNSYTNYSAGQVFFSNFNLVMQEGDTLEFSGITNNSVNAAIEVYY